MRPGKRLFLLIAISVVGIVIATYSAIRPFDQSFKALTADAEKQLFFDRYGQPLNLTFHNRWNLMDPTPLHQIPTLLQHAFIMSEDQHFYTHGGIDWLARAEALRLNLINLRAVRGASTITEQVVRMIHPRPRTIWSRWIEGFEAARLESQYSKADIFEFYLNQVPYRANRRGVVQAAHYYFDRDLSTLNAKEMLALSVLVRSPQGFDPRRHQKRLERSIERLAKRLFDKQLITNQELAYIHQAPLALQQKELKTDARHFIRYVRQTRPSQGKHVYTTLDADLQSQVQELLDTKLKRMQHDNVNNGAVLVVDNQTNEVLAWVVAFAQEHNVSGSDFDAVTIKRQPGSTLKPFVYAKALEKGWNLATMIDDAPLIEGVGHGMHAYKNYSKRYYGPISIREALGNSLNIPAVKAVQYVGSETFLLFLQEAGIRSYDKHPNFYGDGIVLGNSELSLFELVQSYSTLARMGDFMPLKVLPDEPVHHVSVLDEGVASLIGDVLSDPHARQKEFSLNSILNLPYQTAVKTGTSSDYRDAWVVGYNNRFTVGVWFGNLDYTSMNGITGAKGPAYVLRSVFNLLNQRHTPRALYRADTLVMQKVCRKNGNLYDGECDVKDEWFLSSSLPKREAMDLSAVTLRKPTQGLIIAMDPRIPDEVEYFQFKVSEKRVESVQWILNDTVIATTPSPTYDWKVTKGNYRLEAVVTKNNTLVKTKPVTFTVQ